MAHRMKKATASLAAAGALVGLVGVAPANAIVRASALDCSRRQDYLTFINNGRVCFAQAGVISVQIYGVVVQGSGNNMVTTTSAPGGTKTYARWQNQAMSSAYISYIYIH